jgi:hypothetical protein
MRHVPPNLEYLRLMLLLCSVCRVPAAAFGRKQGDVVAIADDAADDTGRTTDGQAGVWVQIPPNETGLWYTEREQRELSGEERCVPNKAPAVGVWGGPGSGDPVAAPRPSPSGHPLHCCLGASHNGGGTYWKEKECLQRGNGCVGTAYRQAAQHAAWHTALAFWPLSSRWLPRSCAPHPTICTTAHNRPQPGAGMR